MIHPSSFRNCPSCCFCPGPGGPEVLMVLAVRRGFFTLLVLTGSLLWLGVVGCEGNREAAPEAAEARPNGYLFCFWNAENLFDDHEDNRANKADKEFDQWFANNPE